MKTISIYIHIPFCIKKCYYCDFISFDQCRDLYEDYIESLVEEIKYVGLQIKHYIVNTIFIGGGTPSILSLRLIEKLVAAITDNFFISDDYEFTIESNPGTLNKEILHCYKLLGINRLSIGLQAIQNNLLLQLGRTHTFELFEDNYLQAKRLGFDNINVDLMFALPNQTLKDWEDTIDTILYYKPSHISAYSLTLEQNTPLFIKQQNKEIILPSEEEDRLMYSIVKQKLKAAGYVHYEISNFAKIEYECKHNLVYWSCTEYIGIGLGAHSFFNDVRFSNTTDLYEYINNNGVSTHVNKLFLTPKDKYSEFMFMGLRLIDGISERDFFKRFNIHVFDIYGSQLKNLMSHKLIKKADDKYSLTDLGMDISNIVFMEFI